MLNNNGNILKRELLSSIPLNKNDNNAKSTILEINFASFLTNHVLRTLLLKYNLIIEIKIILLKLTIRKPEYLYGTILFDV